MAPYKFRIIIIIKFSVSQLSNRKLSTFFSCVCTHSNTNSNNNNNNNYSVSHGPINRMFFSSWASWAGDWRRRPGMFEHLRFIPTDFRCGATFQFGFAAPQTRRFPLVKTTPKTTCEGAGWCRRACLDWVEATRLSPDKDHCSRPAHPSSLLHTHTHTHTTVMRFFWNRAPNILTKFHSTFKDFNQLNDIASFTFVWLSRRCTHMFIFTRFQCDAYSSMYSYLAPSSLESRTQQNCHQTQITDITHMYVANSPAALANAFQSL